MTRLFPYMRRKVKFTFREIRSRREEKGLPALGSSVNFAFPEDSIPKN